MTTSYTCLDCGYAFQSARPLQGESCPQCSSTLLEEDVAYAARPIPVGASVTSPPEEAEDDLAPDAMKAMMGPTV